MRTLARTSIVLMLLMGWTIVAGGPAAAQPDAPPPDDTFHDDFPPPPDDTFHDDFPPPPDDTFHDDFPPPPDDVPWEEPFFGDGELVIIQGFSDELLPADPFGGGLPPEVPPEYAFFIDPTLPVPAGFEWLDDPTLPVPAEYAFLYDPALPVPVEFEWLLGPSPGIVTTNPSATEESEPEPRPTSAPTAETSPEPTSVGVADAVPAESTSDDAFTEAVSEVLTDRELGPAEDEGNDPSVAADATNAPDLAEAEPETEPSSDNTAARSEPDSRPTSIDWQLPTADDGFPSVPDDGLASDVGSPSGPALATSDTQPVRVVTGAPASGMLVPLLIFVALASLALAATIPVLLRRRPSEHDELRELALTDDLTKLANRRRLDRDLRAHRQGDRPIAIAMVDIDHFKKLNDDFGHAAGDRVLQQVAAALSRNIRTGDIVYRYGGEEFCILLPDTSEHEAAAVVDRVRRVIEELRFAELGRAVTISAGVAESAPYERIRDRQQRAGNDRELVELADAALYAAKHAGRNRVALSSLSG